MMGNFLCFLSSADFFQNKLFQKILSGTLSESQTGWIQIRPYILSDLIWVQTVCKDCQQMTKYTAAGTSHEVITRYLTTPRMLLESHLILSDQCNNNLACDIVPQTKSHMFNLPLPHLMRGLP